MRQRQKLAKQDMRRVKLSFPDALAAAPLVGGINAAFLLTNPNALPEVTKAYIDNNNIKNVIIIDGTNSVSTEIENLLKSVQETPETEEPVIEPPATEEPGTETPETETPVTEKPVTGYDPANPKDGLKESPYPDRLIKGNINSKGEKIYHMPGQRDYAKTVIDESAGERWFATAKKAKAAGWRAAMQ